MNITEQFPRPLQLDRVVVTDPNNSYYGQTGILIHMPNDTLRRLRALVVPDSNPKLQIPVDQLAIVHERFASELPKIKQPKRSIPTSAPEVVEQAAETVTEVIVHPTASLPEEPDATPGKRGKPRTTNIVTEELGNAALVKYHAGMTMGAIAKAMNLNQVELSSYFASKGVILKRGRRSA